MKTDDPHSPELDDLLHALREETITDAQWNRLAELLESDPAARRAYLESTTLTGQLRYALEDYGFARQPGEGEASQALLEALLESRNRHHKLRWAPLAAAAAVALLIVAGSLIWSGQDDSGESQGVLVQEGEPTDDGVAVLVDAGEVEWLDGDPPPSDILSPGRLRLKSGLLQLEFYSGARLVVEGPADLEIVSVDEVICRRGRVRAVVPPAAHGFRVVSPQFELVDLGTEFGFAVDPDGESSVQVFDGEVEIYPPGARRSAAAAEKLSVGDGRAWTAQGKRISRQAEPGAFPTFEELQRREAKAAEKRFARWEAWTESLAGDPRIAFRFDFDSVGPELLDRSPTGSHGTIVGAEWATGRWPGKKALEFKRPGDRVRLDLPGTYDAVTMTAWLRVDSLPDRSQSLLLTDGYEVGRAHWHLNGEGYLRLGVRKPSAKLKDGATGYGSTVLITPRRIGAWCFLSTVYDRESGTVRHYFNGNEVSSDEIVYDQPLQFGTCDLGNWTPSRMKARCPVRNFIGRMDELTIWNSALTGDEIRNIYRRTKP